MASPISSPESTLVESQSATTVDLERVRRKLESQFHSLNSLKFDTDSDRRRRHSDPNSSLRYQISPETEADEAEELDYLIPQPVRIKDKLFVNLTEDGNFFIGGDSSVENFIVKTFTNIRNEPRGFLYLKYFPQISKQNQCPGQDPAAIEIRREIFAGPAARSSRPRKRSILPVNWTVKWSEVILEINIQDACDFGLEIGVKGFKDNDYFLVDKSVMVYCQNSPTLEDVADFFNQHGRPGPELSLLSFHVPLTDQEFRIQATCSDCCCNLLKCIFLPFLFLLKVLLWPVFCCRRFCCVVIGENEIFYRSGYQRLD